MSQAYLRPLQTMLEQDLQAARQLNQTLQRERQELGKRNSANLQTLIDEKNKLLEQLEGNSQRRHKFMATQQRPTTRQAWEALLDELAEPALKKLWQELQLSLQEVQKLNDINGKILERNRLIVGRLNKLMRGQNPDDKLYGRSGQQQRGSANGALIQA